MDGAIRTIAIVASAVILTGFAFFAVDQMQGASKHQQEALVDPTATQERSREASHSPVREVIDDANDGLLRPFAGVERSGDAWARRGVPTVLALLVYGLGPGFLARWTRARS